jgi:hypothetical protein
MLLSSGGNLRKLGDAELAPDSLAGASLEVMSYPLPTDNYCCYLGRISRVTATSGTRLQVT